MSPALAGGFLTTGPPGKSRVVFFLILFFLPLLLFSDCLVLVNKMQLIFVLTLYPETLLNWFINNILWNI